QALPKLGKFATDLRLHVVCQQSATVFLGERYGCTAFCKSSDAAITLAGNLVAVGGVEIAQLHPAFKPGLHRTDLCRCDGLKFCVRGLVELLATWNAGLEHIGIVELGPDNVSARRKLDFPCH